MLKAIKYVIALALLGSVCGFFGCFLPLASGLLGYQWFIFPAVGFAWGAAVGLIGCCMSALVHTDSARAKAGYLPSVVGAAVGQLGSIVVLNNRWPSLAEGPELFVLSLLCGGIAAALMAWIGVR